MVEIAAAGQLPSLAPLVSRLAIERALLLLEQAPETWLDERARQQALRFVRADSGEDWDRWSMGRLFNADFELRWEREQGGLRVSYVGTATALPGLAPLEIDLSVVRTVSYSLWGAALQAVERDDAAAGGRPFVELRIPRLLQYPVSAGARFVRLLAREYRDAGDRLILSRFCGLEEEA